MRASLRNLIAVWSAVALLAAPSLAAAQSYYFAAAGGAAVSNPNLSFETLGAGADGSGTAVTGGAANTDGSCVPMGAPASNWSGMDIEIGVSNSSTNRMLFKISRDGGSTFTPYFYAASGTSGGYARLPIPLKVTAGQTICIVGRGSGASAVYRFIITGTVASTSGFPGFDNAEALTTADTTNTRASSTSITLRTTASTYDTVNASTARTYGALLVTMSDNGTAPTAQSARVTLATGAASSETPIGGLEINPAASGLLLPRAGSMLFRQSIPSGSRVSANAQAPSAGAPDVFLLNAVGFY